MRVAAPTAGWATAFLTLALLASTEPAQVVNRIGVGLARELPTWAHRGFSGLLTLGQPLESLALLLAVSVVLYRTWGVRPILTMWGLFAAAEVIELGCKHLGFGAGPTLFSGPPDVLSGRFGVRWPPSLANFQLRGGFPSGHVLRLTILAGFMGLTRGWRLPVMTSFATAIAVVGSGLHTVTEALGGTALGYTALTAVHCVHDRSDSRHP